MIEVTISYVDKKMDETFVIITYLRGDGFWQFLTPEGSTINILDHAVRKVVISPIHDEAR